MDTTSNSEEEFANENSEDEYNINPHASEQSSNNQVKLVKQCRTAMLPAPEKEQGAAINKIKKIWLSDAQKENTEEFRKSKWGKEFPKCPATRAIGFFHRGDRMQIYIHDPSAIELLEKNLCVSYSCSTNFGEYWAKKLCFLYALKVYSVFHAPL